ncbi:prephenate dehydrogenase [Candidatus Kinetoplastibacterium blastocrithidii TCC012E]|uniref:Prephenate dehydrogenase n=1 Tax=Candidatus Kinetoplastidibacterium blastocrithidiae TCC012E TaxID=1208922 RepID=M1MDQ4_9PROT|nr:prephenate dehydrogenase/arogenate dehydrogenase family protein [Candidatus Kinetoplastibacterium blastocrithidii]AFZ83732.1 prephenate dehydrogenase [Candidatus Kinetoplastibacterium blastocrithidii (ex Strigomonas culicis)]AGF49855.1 prephenate dehydrogenase [Candidatus Kinetoplastibacterium blastocrithidii TCC012E]
MREPNNCSKLLRRLDSLSTVTIVGVGLIGGSFALAVRKAGFVKNIIGVGRNKNSLMRACDLGIIDDFMTIDEATKKSDLILLSTPVGFLSDLLKSIKPFLGDNTIITDVGSTKLEVINIATSILGEKVSQFIPGHPIAGLEKSGPDAASDNLFRGQNTILTPLDNNSNKDIELISHAWKLCGSNVIFMSAKNHDHLLASISHIPHFLSVMYMAQVASSEDSDLRLKLAGSGFRDFTRISAGSVEMWLDIFFSNKKFIKEELFEVRNIINQAEKAIDYDDRTSLRFILEKAAGARRSWSKDNFHE